MASAKGSKPHLLPKDAFKSNIVLAVVKREKTVWEFKVEEVTEAKGIVELRYTTTKKKSDSAAVASLVIGVSIKRYLPFVNFITRLFDCQGKL